MTGFTLIGAENEPGGCHERPDYVAAYSDYAFLMEIEECGQLVEDHGDKNVMIMRNHGLLTAGGSVGEAFMRMYYLDKACEIQLDALATGRELELPPPEVCEEAAQRSMVIDSHPLGEVE